MSVYGIKPSFKDYEGYREWRAVWSNIYRDVEARIRASKQVVVNLNKLHKSGPEMSQAWAKLRGERVAAHKLCTLLDEAKVRMNNITTMRKGMTEHTSSFPLSVGGCKSVDFHFNKKHLEYPWIPMWVVKAKGQTYYVNHVDANVPWTTRETPDHTSTKGAIRLRNCELSIDHAGVANISQQSPM
jgi:hypothetical protein